MRSTTLLKEILWDRCVLANFSKILRTPFFIEHLRWLLLVLVITRIPSLYLSVDTWRRSNADTTSYDVVRGRIDVENEVVCQQGDFFSAALYLCFLKLFLCNKHTSRINPLGNFYLICICTVQSNIFFYFICDSSDRTSVIASVYVSYSYDTFLIMFSSYSKTLYVELRHYNRLIMFPRLWKSKNWFCCDLS